MIPYHHLPVIGPFLRSRNINTVEELLAINIAEVSDADGFGIRKLQALIDLVRREKSRISSSPESKTKLEADLSCYLDLEIDRSFGRLPSRISAKVSEHNLITVRDLLNWSTRVNVHKESNYGKKTHDHLISLLNDLARRGPILMVFGTEHAPLSVSELVNSYLNRLDDDRAKRFFELYYQQGKTLQEIGDSCSPSLTRERVRQVISRSLIQDRKAWGSTCEDLLDPVLKLLDVGNGITFLDKAIKACGAGSLSNLRIAIDLANYGWLCISSSKMRLLTTMNSDEFRTWHSEFNSDMLEFIGDGRSTVDVLSYAHSYFDFDDSELIDIISTLSPVTFSDSYVYSSRRSANIIYTETIRKSTQALECAEVAEIVKRLHPDLNASARNVAAHFSRVSNVFKADDSKYLHQDNLPVSTHELEEMTNRALKLIPRNGQAVSVKRLVKEIFKDHPSVVKVSPYTLRDALLNTGKTRSWRSGCDIAWLCENTSRTSIAEMIAEICPTLQQPFSFSELIEAVSTYGGFEASSVYAQAVVDENILLTSSDQHLYKSVVFKDDNDFSQYRDRLYECLPKDEIISSNKFKTIMPADRLMKKYGTGLAFAVLRTHPSVNHRIKGTMLWCAQLGNTSWEATRNSSTFSLPDTFTSSDLQKWYHDVTKATNTQLGYVILKEAIKAGQVKIITPGHFTI